ncbi:cell division cycle 5-like protein [Skeletonema marinoi]|uniref:Cell division cycle 5-like protein n=1 Tax=Skeletonema marinoi TaxID=267567 RepID=A0AAD8YCW0_9STRA|nr:cell division cycle 5-like protein [Skeletonema marinoi]
MVRVFIKGGVWKNSEDEILKAAVMKYGKQQWARVASLLNRKSAKQCKARWNEWLDPSVRKVEWSREEDEKLLHLAKLMPAQWRTIGPLVGRTGGQCQERYERLLDEAAGGGEAGGGNEEDGGAVGGAIAARKLRPGEIDPHPETKPARPDPIDMDEDEVEMLQEARARLANTQGKKAKRKAREKMLADAKRLADLQKRRELKAAGLLSGEAKSRSKKRLRDIDLGVEIPFHKPAPAGFHATGDEDERAEIARNQRLKDVDYKRIHEMQYRQRDREAKERQKREEARLRSLERSNMQYVVAEVAKRNDPIASRKRGVLNMPEPTIADDELRRVAKASEEEKEALASLAAAGGDGGSAAGGATTALLGDYSDRPLPTPMRTPASSSMAGKPSRTDVIQREAMNLRALGAGTGVGLAGAAAAYGATPMLGGTSVADDATAGMKRKASTQTPLTQASSHRDELGLNARIKAPLDVGPVVTNDDASVGASSFGASTFASRHMSVRELAKEERRRAKRARKELEDALANLPAPQFEYELAVPEDVPMEEADEDERVGRKMLVKDAAELDAEEIKRLQREAEKLYEEQSSVIKRPDLPRPKSGVVLDRIQETVSDQDLAMVSAAKLINEEMTTLISHDAYAHPVHPDKKDPIVASLMSEGKGKKDKKDKKQKRELLSSATGKYYENDSDVLDAVAADTVQAARGSKSQLSFSNNGWEQGVEGDDRTAETLYAEYKAIQNATSAVAKSCSKLEQKLVIQTGGYNQRSQSLIDSSMQSFAMLQHSKIEAVVYSRLRSHEIKGAQLRIESLRDEIERLEEEETKKQKKYGELVHTKNRLQLKIRSQERK